MRNPPTTNHNKDDDMIDVLKIDHGTSDEQEDGETNIGDSLCSPPTTDTCIEARVTIN